MDKKQEDLRNWQLNFHSKNINSNASILSNCLYALITSALAAVIALDTAGRIKGSILSLTAYLFLASLVLCVVSIAVEWYRGVSGQRKVLDDPAKGLDDTTYWRWVIGLKTLAYVLLFVGIYTLIHNIS